MGLNVAEYEYRSADGRRFVVDAPAGLSAMRAAISNGVPGIVAECGGQAMCGTCHVLVADDLVDALPPIGDDEEDMLSYQVVGRDERRSRLSCQLTVPDGVDRLVFDVPESQY